MIYTVISDYRKIEPLFEENSPVGFSDRANAGLGILTPEVRAHIKKAKRKKLRAARAGAYLTLYHSLLRYFPEKEKSLLWSDEGKPALENREGQKRLWINLSHTEGLCAVVLSDEGEVGVDIEGEISEERARRLEGRFFEKLTATDRRAEITYLFAALGESGELIFEEPREGRTKKTSPRQSFGARWTLAEAIMKCDGRGFLSIKELLSLSENMATDTRRFVREDKAYYLSVAVKENKSLQND